jgi:hypothetical protein
MFRGILWVVERNGKQERWLFESVRLKREREKERIGGGRSQVSLSSLPSSLSLSSARRAKRQWQRFDAIEQRTHNALYSAIT